MIPEVTFAGRQMKGGRENQEDSYGFCLVKNGGDSILLLALADGMGGHERGEIASEIAVSSFIQSLDVKAPNVRRALIDAVLEANTRIGAENERRGGLPDEMGTTMVGDYVRNGQLQWVSVGDSPLFLFRSGKLHRLNEEHVGPPIESPNGGPPKAPMLISALTGGEINRMDAPVHPCTLEKGDIVICASDGINSIELKRIAAKLEILADLPAAALAESLVAAVDAERKSRQDNLTIAIVKHSPSLV
jgi:serine/threonine protein phosphatase PrpC